MRLKTVFEDLDKNLSGLLASDERFELLKNLKVIVDETEKFKTKSLEELIKIICDAHEVSCSIIDETEVEILKEKDGMRIVTIDYLFKIFPDMVAFAEDKDTIQCIYFGDIPKIDDDYECWNFDEGSLVELKKLNFFVEHDKKWNDSLVVRNNNISVNDIMCYNSNTEECFYTIYNNGNEILCVTDFNNLKDEIDYHILALLLSWDMNINNYTSPKDSFLWKYIKDMDGSDPLCECYIKEDDCKKCCFDSKYYCDYNKGTDENFNIIKEKLNKLIIEKSEKIDNLLKKRDLIDIEIDQLKNN